VRAVVTLWVLMVIPIIGFSVTMAVIGLPRIVATAGDSVAKQYHGMTHAFSQGHYMGATAGALATFAVALPAASVTYMFLRTCRRFVRGTWRFTSERQALRFALVPAYALVAAGLAWLWWPNGEYHPLHKGEKWTVQDTLSRARHVASGRPGTVEKPIAQTTETTVSPTTSTTLARSSVDDDDSTHETHETTTTVERETTSTTRDTTETTAP
jgi:putative peptide zinc metalloprotease protein